MGFLKHLRSKSRQKTDDNSPRRAANPARGGRDFSYNLDAALIRKILVQVCPHSQDTTYEPSERSSVGDGCMLCDLRDLAKASQVCRKWYTAAQDLL